MPRTLPLVLVTTDLPTPELLASRLDGELFTLESGFCPVDEIVGPAHRAFLACSGMHEKLIPEQLTAAWVWGATDHLPTPAQFCVRLDARVGHPTALDFQVREVVIEDTELVAIGQTLVTSPLRTAVDITRFSDVFTDRERRAVSALMTLGDFDANDITSYLTSRHKLPLKKRALARTLGIVPASPS